MRPSRHETHARACLTVTAPLYEQPSSQLRLAIDRNNWNASKKDELVETNMNTHRKRLAWVVISIICYVIRKSEAWNRSEARIEYPLMQDLEKYPSWQTVVKEKQKVCISWHQSMAFLSAPACRPPHSLSPAGVPHGSTSTRFKCQRASGHRWGPV